MGLPRKALRTALTGALCSVLLAAGPASGAGSVAGTGGRAGAPVVRFVDVEGDGGTVLKANVVAPADAGPGRSYPLVVLPTSWAMPQLEYLAQAGQFAAAGYVVVSYNSRGFWQSGGEIEVAGPPDVADASRVIDWALAHTPADPARVGMAGVSYGAGISLLAAAEDPRIKAVAALSGWADLAGSIYSGRTQHAQAAAVLTGLGFLTGRPSAELRGIMADFLSSRLDQEQRILDWAARRSVDRRIAGLNARGTAVMLGNAWGDSIFPPNQYAEFFERLTGPKRLEFRPGDHATAEGTGLFGLPNDTWTSTRRWFDHHLRGVDNGVDREPPVRLKSRSDGEYEGYRDWRSVGSAERRLPLGGTQRVLTGVDSGANGGLVLLSGALDQFTRVPPIAAVPLLPRAFAAVWQSERYDAPQRIRGTSRLHTTVTGTGASGTLVAYLYDVGPLGLGKLVTSAPYTFHGRTPGTPFAVDLELFSTAYDVPAGHRLAVVVDTVDPLYIEHNPAGAQLTFSSPADDPSQLSVPLREE
ncbi:alpha/beta fold hydrolase [Streptomyces clavuligerus]|uniref:S15 family peptidase n=1 Tax=Streptomyces clavuligerus TaxID=1901 RepID=B5GRR6_STRCL|nr:alpha/beta fold hydrolase [Streptomyces clavuligerus]ANW17412.1 acyl esterase [Streptomyces clavuligerus]AXU11962.1 acyl esterase [Streptomyces clavuligerus]EDY49012.1 acyl esterase [Streptomyces clavuligerus]EFG10105.1 S15 family peptidase [Streptomyces clavuligerus]MBY6301806.1 acetylxylan esterase [Streptomyces clavuligerus]